MLKGLPDVDRATVEKWTVPLLEEFLHNVDYEEAINEVANKFSSGTINLFVESLFNQVLERSQKARSLVGHFLSKLLKKGIVTESQFLDGLDCLLLLADDLIVDIPKFWDFLANILAPIFSSGALGLTILKKSAFKANMLPGDSVKCSDAGKYVVAILQEMGRSGHIPVIQLWRQSGLQWIDFLSDETSVEDFLVRYNLEWIVASGDSGEVIEDLNEQRLRKEMKQVLDCNRLLINKF